MNLEIESETTHTEVGTNRLPGILTIPKGATGIVLFAHGSGSSRLSPRNQHVAQVLQEAGLATLLFDLLDEIEAEDRRNVFEVPLLAQRLVEAAEWVLEQRETKGLRLGFFGASTGAAAALVAETQLKGKVAAVVSRGGRPDMAERILGLVSAPTLLIVGGRDEAVIQMNQRAFEMLQCEKQLRIVDGATHLFPEPGALEQVAKLASQWFSQHLK
ncbi:MAG: dienelactone hydrolase family protein [Planctomycetota bacterium]|jgi:putative phosphoribosyl transferase